MLLWKYPLVYPMSLLLEMGFAVKSFHTYLICFRTIDFQQTSWDFFFFFSMWQQWYFFFFFLGIAKLKKALISRPSKGTWTMKQRDVQCININIFISQKTKQTFGLREIWAKRSSMSRILQELLSNQSCTLLSFSHERAEWIGLWMAL